MGRLVMVMGRSGSGKSTSLHGFEPGTVGVVSVAGKPLPFRKDLGAVRCKSYEPIVGMLRRNAKNAYVIDDSTYLMQFDNFRYATVKGFDKFVDMAVAFEALLEVAAFETDADTMVYLLHHPQFGEHGSDSKPQTIGKMLDNQLNVEGLFPCIIECRVNPETGEHEFSTKESATGIFKVPYDPPTGERMLPEVMPNDLKAVDDAARAWWGMRAIDDYSGKREA